MKKNIQTFLIGFSLILPVLAYVEQHKEKYGLTENTIKQKQSEEPQGDEEKLNSSLHNTQVGAPPSQQEGRTDQHTSTDSLIDETELKPSLHKADQNKVQQITTCLQRLEKK